MDWSEVCTTFSSILCSFLASFLAFKISIYLPYVVQCTSYIVILYLICTIFYLFSLGADDTTTLLGGPKLGSKNGRPKIVGFSSESLEIFLRI